MRRRFQGLHQADQSATSDVPDGLYLARVHRAQYRWHAHKPYYLLGFTVLEPLQLQRTTFTGRLYCITKTLWKLSWFLRDFGYDAELLGHDEVEEKNLVGLRGVVKVSHNVVNGTPLLNLDGFAPTSQWEKLSVVSPGSVSGRESAQ